MKSHRIARINEVIREVTAETILFQLRDPRVKNITVTRVETSADLQSAKVYVSVMGSEKEQIRAVNGLQNAAGFIQSRLAKRLTTRFLPVLTFFTDEGIKKSIEVARILHEERLKNGLSEEENLTDAELIENDELDEFDEDTTDELIDDDDADDVSEDQSPVAPSPR